MRFWEPRGEISFLTAHERLDGTGPNKLVKRTAAWEFGMRLTPSARPSAFHMYPDCNAQKADACRSAYLL